MSFKCDQCGICCRNIGGIEELADYHSGDGICKYLLPNNLCSIYNERPIWCNVDLYYECFLRDKMTRAEWYALNEKACSGLKGSHGEPTKKHTF